MDSALVSFHPTIAAWFESRVGTPTPPQTLGWPVIAAGESALILAPTGSGKTLAAFLAAIDWVARKLLAAEQADKPVWGVQILYVSPLKALANDVQKNLLKPLAEIAEVAAAQKIDWPEIHVAVRTGDTPAKERAAMLRRPPHILITTPESLNLMLMSAARGMLTTAKFLIVDEVHALAGSKRGVFLSLLLERLEHERRAAVPQNTPSARSRAGLKIAPGVYVPVEDPGPLIRVGLSATARPEETIARWLAGHDDARKPRPIRIVKSGQRKRLDLQVVCPFGQNDETAEQDPTSPNQPAQPKGTGHWPEVTRAILAMIRAHRSTLIFGNSRRLIERLAARFQEELEKETASDVPDADDFAPGNAAAPIKNPKSEIKNPPARIPIILPHHGSIAKEVRLETELALKRGEVDAVLATSSLELGIDIGALDLVIQIDSPGNVAAGLQRVGRAGHLEKATAKGRFIARGNYELPSFGALVPLMFEGLVEETRVPENCLDVLAQQIVAATVTRPWKRADLFRVFRRATPFHGLSEKQFDSVVTMLSKRAERVTAQGLRPRISFDRVNDELIILPGSAQVVTTNSGVIADTGQFPVYLAGATKGRTELSETPTAPREVAQARWGGGNGKSSPTEFQGVRIGELDEEFVYETKEGDRIILGSQTWRVIRIDADRVIVEHAEPGSSRMPFWRGENAPRSEMLGEAVARFHKNIVDRLAGDEPAVKSWLTSEHHFDSQAAENAITFYQRQLHKGAVPVEGSAVVEHFTDRTGEPIIAILLPLGSRVNYAIRLALEGQFARRRLPAQVVHHDDGLIIRPPVEVGEIPENPLAWLKSRTLEQEIVDQLESTALFGLRFRQNAARALMLPRMTLTQRTPLWQQRLRARHLLALVKQQRNFPIMVETYRECLQDVLNIPRVTELLRHLETGEWSVRLVKQAPGNISPFARSLFSQFMQSYLYEWDDPLSAHQLEPAVDQRVLDEILQRRTDGDAPAPAALEKSWDDVDEETLRRRILGVDYPARTAEELLEKIESAGAAGVPLALDDPAWEEWAVGGAQEARRMLLDLAEKKRVILVRGLSVQRGMGVPPMIPKTRSKNSKETSLPHWLGIENLALLLAARDKKTTLHFLTLTGTKESPLTLTQLPPALLETTLTPAEARRLIVEQALKRRPVTTRDQLLADLPWLPETNTILDTLLAENLALPLAPNHLIWSEYAEQLRAMALRRQRRLAATVDIPALERHLLRWQNITPASAEPANAMDALDRLEDALDLLTGLAFPLDLWELDILPLRVPTFTPAMLDGICGTGHRVWVGTRETNDAAAIALWPRHLLATRPASPTSETPPSANAQKTRDHLRSHGASFFFDLQLALNLSDGELALALRELARAGEISSDQLQSLRDVLRLAETAARDNARAPAAPRLHATHARHTPRPSKMPRNWWRTNSGGISTTAGNLGGVGGRWFLLPPTATNSDNATDRAQRAADRVDRLLRRTAFACRELLEPAVDGPWRDAYDVLTRMEWAGTVRRGYFVDGIAGSQFALPTAQLSQPPASDSAVLWLSMLDPANLWSRVSTRWITDAGVPVRVARAPGNWIALVDGRPVLAAVSWGNRLLPLPAPEADQCRAVESIATLLPRLPRNSHPYLAVKFWGPTDSETDILHSPAEKILHAQGFTRDPQGLRLYRSYQTTP